MQSSEKEGSKTKNDERQGNDDDDGEEEEGNPETTTKTQPPLLADGHGQWSVSRADEVEVWSYRIALSLSCCGALGVAAGSSLGKAAAINRITSSGRAG